jgi:hypothetical protein
MSATSHQIDGVQCENPFYRTLQDSQFIDQTHDPARSLLSVKAISVSVIVHDGVLSRFTEHPYYVHYVQ